MEHPISTNELCSKLPVLGIHTDRRTIVKDIAVLNEQGYEVMQTKLSKQNAYYIEERSFSLPELEILIEVVQAASFIRSHSTIRTRQTL